MFDSLLARLAPHSCCGCGKIGAVLCEHCIENIVSEPMGYCALCERPAVTAACRACGSGMAWDGFWVGGTRQGVLRRLVDLYKFERVMAADAALASTLALRLPQLPADTVCAYVPAIAAHRRQRGYDHMHRVAQRLARLRGWRVAPLLVRRRDEAQRGNTRQERLRRQEGAFEAAAAPVTGSILLIDDVYTTGATLRAATAALREHYDLPIFAAVIAHQPSSE